MTTSTSLYSLRPPSGAALGRGKLAARPRAPSGEPGPVGLSNLGLESNPGGPRDGYLYVPPNYRAERPAPLVLMLHGAGGNRQHGIAPLLNLADQAGLILLAPDSRERTWDLLLHGYGADVQFIDESLEYVFERYAVDRQRLAIGGFSDGASYALSLGITNGDLFSHLIAFSPGFMAPTERQDSPRIFVSHGVQDQVLPIDRCSRVLVPRLRGLGFEVEYVELEDGHTVPLSIAGQAVDWFTRTSRENAA